MRERLWDAYSTQTAAAAQAKAPVASKRRGRANKRDWDHRPMAATGAVEITLPVAIVAAAYIIGQGLVGAGKDG